MKTLIQKDLRENLKVALIGLLIFSLLLLQGYQTCIELLTNLLAGNSYSSERVNNLHPLLSSDLLVKEAFFCAIFGAALGWLQTRNEAHRDLWAFLIHRPITRTEIFWAKTVAGLFLYIFGAGIPLAILVAVVRTPGHIAAPFEWAMVLPSASIFLTGVAYYFAGLLTGLRQARWYASRALGLGLAIIASFGVFTEFWFSPVLIAITVVILATAVWGSYQSGGFYRGQSVTGRLALTLAMAAGCSVALIVAMGLLFTLIINPLSHHSYVFSRYEMTREGTIYKQTWRDGELVELVDLDGHPLLDPKTGQKMEQKEFQKHFSYGGGVTTSFKHRNQNRNLIQDDAADFFSLVNITDKTLWYLDRHGKLTGYDSRTRKNIGSLNPRDYDGPLTAEPFLTQLNSYSYYNGNNGISRILIPAAKTVYQVDFKNRTVKPVFNLPNDDEIGGYSDVRGGYDDNLPNNFLISTRKTVCLMDYEGRVIFAVPYQPAYFQYPTVQISLLQSTNSNTNIFAVWFYPDYRTNQAADWKMPVHVLWIGPEQAVTKSADLATLIQPESDDNSWSQKLMTALLPPPVQVEFDKKIFNMWNLFSCALALICGATGWTLARRFNFSIRASIGWTLFIFLLGTAGLLTLLCVQEWPVRETCPDCKKLRAVDREFCEHCESPFSPLEKSGTEIFEPLAKV